MNPKRRWSHDRRSVIQCGALAAVGPWPLPRQAHSQDTGPDRRLALLIGNRDYPPPHDLPPIPKNLRDLQAALSAKGFAVEVGTDLPVERSRAVLDSFINRVRESPPDSTALFYFCGHGVQVDAANLLIAAGTNPAAADQIPKGSLQLLADIVARLPPRADGMTIAVVDACRTALRPTSTASDAGLNQVEAPPGCLIAFSTGAGRPAIAPAVETANTFYTASLVKVLNSASGDLSFSDLFRLVKIDVEQTMLAHPIEAIRNLVQRPFIAENTRRSIPLLPVSPRVSERPGQEEADWKLLEASNWPAEVVQRATAFAKAWPESSYSATLKVTQAGAEEALRALQRPDVRLFRSAFQVQPDDTAEHRLDVSRAGRGDKDAAARLGRRAGPTQRGRYEGWLQLATALGNGIAAYELALAYRASNQPQLAAQFEARARELGYTPPPSLDNVRK